MASHAGEDGGLPRTTPTPFLAKTYQIVDDPSVDDVISWNDDGSTFVVWRPAEFARDLLPKYFKHNNFSSFVRQLNTYGFRKIVPDRWEFGNECFRRGEKRLLCEIHRRKVAPAPIAVPAAPAAAPAVPAAIRSCSPANSGDEQVLSSNSSGQQQAPSGSHSAGGGGDLADENDHLRRENARLARELGQMKKLCNNILSLMTKYAASQGDTGESSAPQPPPATILQLMTRDPPAGDIPDEDMNDEPEEDAGEGCHRLFGVSIGMKRPRNAGAGVEVKAEAMDAEPLQLGPASGSGSGSGSQPWAIYRPRAVHASPNGFGPAAGPKPEFSGSDRSRSNSM